MPASGIASSVVDPEKSSVLLEESEYYNDTDNTTRPSPLLLPEQTASSPASSSFPTSSTRRAPYHPTAFLDGLRGLAALFVFFQHYTGGFVRFGEQDFGFGQDGKFYYICGLPFIRILWSGGNMAVVVFFVLSGYVLSIGPLSKLRKGENASCRRSLLGSIVRRPFRLYAPPLAIAFITALLLQVPGPLMAFNIMNQPQESIWTEIKNWFSISIMYFDPRGMHDNNLFYFPYNIAVWTMPVELKGSMWVYGVLMVCTVLLSTTNAERQRVGAVATVVGIMAVTMLQLNHKWSGAAFTFGIFLAFVDAWSLDTWGPLGRVSQRTWKVIHHACFIVGWYLLSEPVGNEIEFSSHTPGWAWLTSLIPSAYGALYFRYWQNWGALLLVYSTLRLQWLQKFFSTRALKYLGKVSFMFYLVHLPFFRIFPDRFRSALGGVDPLPGDPPKVPDSWWDDKLWIPDIGPIGLSTRFFVAVAVSLPLTLLLAELATKHIDTPSVALGERVASLVGLGREKKQQGREALILPS